MTEQAGLFDAEQLRVAPATDEPGLTPGAQMRRRQAAAIATGMHPLSLVAGNIRLHPAADQPTEDDHVITGLRCGGCVFYTRVGGHSRTYAKCWAGRTVTPIPRERQTKFGPKVTIREPRTSHGLATDLRRWWPACRQYEPKEPA